MPLSTASGLRLVLLAGCNPLDLPQEDASTADLAHGLHSWSHLTSWVENGVMQSKAVIAVGH